MPGTTARGYPFSLGSDTADTIDTTMQSLAEKMDARPGVSSLTTIERNALAGAAELWDGRIIWNKTTAQQERYNAGTTSWIAASASTAAAVSYSGSTDLVATNVEAALDELDSEKLSVADANAAYVAKAGGDTITASAAAVVPLVVKGAAAQTGNLFEARNDAGTVLAFVAPAGHIAGGVSNSYIFNRQTASPNAYLSAEASGQRVLVVRGAAGQTANLAEFQNSAGTVLVNITSSGGLIVNANTQSMVGTDTGASGAVFTVDSFLSGNKALVVRGRTSQTANLAEFQNSAGTVLASISAAGEFAPGNVVGGTQVGAFYGYFSVNVPGVGLRKVQLFL